METALEIIINKPDDLILLKKFAREFQEPIEIFIEIEKGIINALYWTLVFRSTLFYKCVRRENLNLSLFVINPFKNLLQLI